MTASESIKDLAAALALAQASMRNAVLNRTNPHFRSKYADLASVRDAVTESLSKHGLSVSQLFDAESERLFIVTRLMHTSGEWLESRLPIIADMAKPQAVGSAISYMRRYSLAAIAGIAAEEDDDGEAAAQASDPAAPFMQAIAAAVNISELDSWGHNNKGAIDALTKPIQERIRGAFKAKKAVLSRSLDTFGGGQADADHAPSTD